MARMNNNIWCNVWNAVGGNYNNVDYARSGYYTNEFASNNAVAECDQYGYQNNNVDYAPSGYYTNEFASNNAVAEYDNYGYQNNNDYGNSRNGSRGMFQQQQFYVWENQSDGQAFGLSSLAFSHYYGYSQRNQNNVLGAAVITSGYHDSHNNRSYPIAKRSRWDSTEKENRIVPYNRSNERRITCYTCGQFFPDYKSLHEHRDARHKRSFYCSICNKECPSFAILKKHETSHTMNACQKCPETFKYKESLIAHVKHAHPVQLPALPAIAEDSGTEADQGIAHQSNDISNPEHHSIEKLEKTASKSSFSEPAAASTPLAEKKNLPEASVSSDSGVKPEQFQCPYCIKSFDSEKNMYSHCKIHTEASVSSDSGVKTEQFQCPYCIKSFDSEKNMYSHCKIHTEADPDADGSSQTDEPQNKPGLSCPLCIKKFTTCKVLSVHMSSVHTQYFYCLKCPAKLSSKSQLTAHQEVHN